MKRLLALGGVLVLVAMFSGLLISKMSPVPVEGPLTAVSADDSFGFPADVGEDHTFGWIVLGNESQNEVVITSVSLLDAGEAIGQVGTLAVNPHDLRDGMIGHQSRFPPDISANPRPVEGYVVAPQGDINILLGIEVNRSGIHSFRGIRIDYRSGDRAYSLDVPTSVRFCAPRSEFEQCSAE